MLGWATIGTEDGAEDIEKPWRTVDFPLVLLLEANVIRTGTTLSSAASMGVHEDA